MPGQDIVSSVLGEGVVIAVVGIIALVVIYLASRRTP